MFSTPPRVENRWAGVASTYPELEQNEQFWLVTCDDKNFSLIELRGPWFKPFRHSSNAQRVHQYMPKAVL